MKPSKAVYAMSLVLVSGAVAAADVTVQMQKLTEKGAGESIGTVVLRDTEHGLMVLPKLAGLAPGAHGFHIHQNPDCGPGSKEGKTVPGLAAGGHFDPKSSGHHEGPAGKGHLGDLPTLLVDADGDANVPVFAPRLRTTDVAKRSLMVHAEGDNYSDDPKPLGGGGARVACGVIQAGGT